LFAICGPAVAEAVANEGRLFDGGGIVAGSRIAQVYIPDRKRLCQGTTCKVFHFILYFIAVFATLILLMKRFSWLFHGIQIFCIPWLFVHVIYAHLMEFLSHSYKLVCVK
jgi:hypothetical protein